MHPYQAVAVAQAEEEEEEGGGEEEEEAEREEEGEAGDSRVFRGRGGLGAHAVKCICGVVSVRRHAKRFIWRKKSIEKERERLERKMRTDDVEERGTERKGERKDRERREKKEERETDTERERTNVRTSSGHEKTMERPNKFCFQVTTGGECLYVCLCTYVCGSGGKIFPTW